METHSGGTGSWPSCKEDSVLVLVSFPESEASLASAAETESVPVTVTANAVHLALQKLEAVQEELH